MVIARAVGRIAAIIETHIEGLDGHHLTAVDRDQLMIAPASRIPMLLARHGAPSDPLLNRRMEQAMADVPPSGWPKAMPMPQQGEAHLAYYAERTAIGRAQKLAWLKQQAGLSRDALAERLGQRSDTVRDWLTGRRDISAAQMQAAEDAMAGKP